MFLLREFTFWLFSPSGIIGLITILTMYYFARFYTRVFLNYPPGPFPLPIIGNFLLFRDQKTHMNLQIKKLCKKYGPVFTIWLGPEPIIVISDLNLAKEAFNKRELCGKPISHFSSCFDNEQHRDIIFSDMSLSWFHLKKVAHNTISKYYNTDVVKDICNEVMDQNVKMITTKEGTDKPFKIHDYFSNIFANILGSAVFSVRINIEENEFKGFKYLVSDWVLESGSNVVFWEFFPFSNYLITDPLIKFRKIVEQSIGYLKNIYEQHLETFDETNKRDFCDILINSKLEAVANDKESANFLSKENLVASQIDLIVAGAETTRSTFEWCLLFMIYYPEYQQKLRDEINTKIGDREPALEDREQLNYVMAFISEILRFRNSLPVGTLHKAVVETKLDKYVIPRDTTIIVHQYYILMDDKYWIEPEKFNPNRFLDQNGKYSTVQHPAYIPFGIGRRICVGEKLAYVNLFMVLVRLLQLTNEFDIILNSNYKSIEYLEPEPGFLFLQEPKRYQIEFKQKIH